MVKSPLIICKAKINTDIGIILAFGG
jgi:hypothetical protein